MKIIPIFIPHAGCPYKCAYCDQHRISGTPRMPTAKEVCSIIESHLKTLPAAERKEVAFFGGTFTFLPDKLQERYLKAVFTYIKEGVIQAVRMSTHPEAVSRRSMVRFREKGGYLVELGVQSLDRKVLRNIRRGAGIDEVRKAAAHIKKTGLRLGVQIMVGLPGDTLEKSIKIAKALIRLRPETARIYPALVLRGTALADACLKGKYVPLSLDKAVRWSAELADLFEVNGVKVIRIGLHPSRGLDSGDSIVKGPYHRAFGQMVRSRQMCSRIIASLKHRYLPNRSHIEVWAPREMLGFISGHKGAEKRFLKEYFRAPLLIRYNKMRARDPLRAPDNGIKVRDVRRDIALIDPRMPSEAKRRLKQLNYYIAEVPLHAGLQDPVKGHADMMLFKYKSDVVYEPSLESIAAILRQNGYRCLKGRPITSLRYPADIRYNACNINGYIIHYKGRIEKRIREFKCRHIPVTQGYAKCSIVPVDRKSIITSDRKIKEVWERVKGRALLVRPGHIRLSGYKTGFIGGATGVDGRFVFFTGSLEHHPDGRAIRGFIKDSGKKVIELYDGPLYDVGSIYFFKAKQDT